MHRKIALVGVLLLLLSLVPAVTGLAHTPDPYRPHWDLVDANGPISGLVDSPPTGQNWVYNGVRTAFYYQPVATYRDDDDPVLTALSHLNLGLCDDMNTQDISGEVLHWNGSTWVSQGGGQGVGTDGSTGFYGFKWDTGSSVSKETAGDYLYVLYVAGEVTYFDEESDWLIKAGAGQQPNNGNHDGGTTYDGEFNGWVTAPSSSTCGGSQLPSGSVSVSKTGNDVCNGGEVQWVVSGTYTSTVPVDIVITDPLWSQPVRLENQAAGANLPFSVDPNDLMQTVDTEAGTVSNQVSVALYAAGTQDLLDETSATATVDVFHPSLSLTATVYDSDDNPVTGQVPYGTQVYIVYTVINDGDVDLINVNVSGYGDSGFTPTTLLAGGSHDFTTATFSATTDLDTTASAAGEYSDLECPATASADVDLLVGDPATVGVSKSGSDICFGSNIQWVVSGTYSSDVDVDIEISDPTLWDDPILLEDYPATNSGTFSVNATELVQSITDDTLEQVSNSVSVRVLRAGTSEELDSASASVTVNIHHPAIDLSTSVHLASDNSLVTGPVAPGTQVYVSYTVENTGDVDLTGVSVTANSVTYAPVSLTAGSSDTFNSATFAVNGNESWTAVASGLYPQLECPVSDSEPVSVTVTPPTYGVDVELTGSGDCETFTWVATVTNNSSVSATIDVEFDRLPGETVTLNAGQTATVTRTETGTGTRSLEVTAFLQQGEIEDVAEATATAECPTCEFEPIITLDVTSSNGSNRVPRGTEVDFFYTVTNTGEVPVDVVVTVGTQTIGTISGLAPDASHTLTEEDVAINGTTTRSATATATVEDQLCGDDVATDTHTVRNPSPPPPPPSYGVDVSLTGSADCDTGFTWVATVTNRSDSAVTVNVDFDRDGIADQAVSLGAGASQQLTRTEEGTGNKDLSVTATIAGRSESDSASASAGVECIPPPPPEQPPEVCVPVIKVHVMDESMAGIGGALVKLGDFTTTTAADGWASFPGLPAGTYQISATASGYVAGSGSVTLEAGACEVTAHVTVTPPTFPPPPPPPPTGNITGNICLLEGLDAVEVMLQNGQTALVPSGGSYRFEGLPAGTYTVSASSNLGADSQQVSIGGESPLDAVVDFCFQAAPAQAPLPRTGGPLWPSYAGGMALLALGMVLRRRIG